MPIDVEMSRQPEGLAKNRQGVAFGTCTFLRNIRNSGSSMFPYRSSVLVCTRVALCILDIALERWGDGLRGVWRMARQEQPYDLEPKDNPTIHTDPHCI